MLVSIFSCQIVHSFAPVDYFCAIAEFLLSKHQAVHRNKFRIRRELREQIQTELSCSDNDLLHTLLDIYKEKSLAEISDFQVAAAGVGYSGDIYLGVNVETPFANLGHTVHAEQFAIVNAHQSKEAGISRFAVSDYPCGHCRQFMFELPEPKSIAIDIPMHGVEAGSFDLGLCVFMCVVPETRLFLNVATTPCMATELEALLPHSFSGTSLNPNCPTLLSKTPIHHHHELEVPSEKLGELEIMALAAVSTCCHLDLAMYCMKLNDIDMCTAVQRFVRTVL